MTLWSVYNTGNLFSGDEIPVIDYTDGEIDLWNKVYGGLHESYPKYACKEYLDGLKQLEDHNLIKLGEVPVLKGISAYLECKELFNSYIGTPLALCGYRYDEYRIIIPRITPPFVTISKK